METKVDNTTMRVEIAALATEFGLLPGQILGALGELGVQHDETGFESDEDILELVKEALGELKGTNVVALHHGVTPRDVAKTLGIKEAEIQKTLMTKMRVMATLTTSLKDDQVEKLLELLGFQAKWAEAAPAKQVKPAAKAAKPVSGEQPRPPVVTILGHVDHGKTSLLDYIRKANVAAKEHGGITQHIGAYQVSLPEGLITFLDTPGHAAFTAMRARGAQVTDIAVLVVAADDGIMPQTIEAISHVKNANVPMIVAVNKIDKAEALPDRVLQQLTEFDVVPEAFGGQVITCPVSAITGEGVPHLLEMILLQAEVLQLTADPKAELKAVVIEGRVDKGRGPVATLLVQQGTIKAGDALVVGHTYGKVRTMIDHTGAKLTAAGPSTPVEILGLEDAPVPGDQAEFYASESEARIVANDRKDTERVRSLKGGKKSVTLRDLRRNLEEDEFRDLNLIVKADVQGSVEAVRGLLEKTKNEEVNVRVIHSGVGSINESDILLASSAGAICVGFNVKPEIGAKREAERTKVEIRTYTIIYELIEDIEAAIKGMLTPKYEEQHQGTVEIRIVFNLSRHGMVAGSHVTEGKITRGSNVRVTRGRDVVFEGKVASLKNVKQDAREMIAGQDCGLQFDGWTGFKEGDIVESFELVQINA